MTMADERAISRYRHWYRRLLRFHSKPFRAFAEGMEQTFNDLCRERARAGEGLGGFVLWMFVETSVGIMRENGRSMVMQNKIWINAAAGIIGDGPVNLMCFGGACRRIRRCLCRAFPAAWNGGGALRDSGRSMLVPVITLVIWKAGWQICSLILTHPIRRSTRVSRQFWV